MPAIKAACEMAQMGIESIISTEDSVVGSSGLLAVPNRSIARTNCVQNASFAMRIRATS